MSFPQSWQGVLKLGDTDIEQQLIKVQERVAQERALGKLIFPSDDQVFSALDCLAPEQVKVVILGQDPYHQPGQAHGFAFSVPQGIAIPPSLRNIFKALQIDFPNYQIPEHGCLTSWAEQGVLLLNSVLTVEHNKAGSHHNWGWEIVTEHLLDGLAKTGQSKVFIGWGNQAIRRLQGLNLDRHLLLTGVHPSPLSAYRGFFKQGHFKKCNEQLIAWGQTPILW